MSSIRSHYQNNKSYPEEVVPDISKSLVGLHRLRVLYNQF